MIRRVTLFLLASICTLCAEWRSVGNVGAVVRQPDGVELRSPNVIAKVTAVGDLGFRVRVASGGQFSNDISWALDPKFSPAPVQIDTQETNEYITLKIPSGRVVITRSPMRLAFYDNQNTLINEDAEPMAFDGNSFRVTKRLPVGERYYGLGDKTSLVLNDRAFTLWNTDEYGWEESSDPLYKAIPFFMAMNQGRGYGIFLDNTWRSYFDFGKERHDELTFGAEGGEINYYFYFGPEPKRVLASYTAMTGHMPMPPLWTFGYQQSRYSYYPESQVRELVNTFRQHTIPLDAVYLDIDYQDRNRPFTVDPQRFPNFAGMVQDLRKQGVSTVVINDLHIAKADYPPYNSGTQQDVFIHNRDGSQFVGVVWPGPSVFPDFTLTRARQWWGALYAEFVRDGVRGIWNDMNEPSVFQVPSKTMPLDTVHRLDDGSTLPHLAAHNILGLENARAVELAVAQDHAHEAQIVRARGVQATATHEELGLLFHLK